MKVFTDLRRDELEQAIVNNDVQLQFTQRPSIESLSDLNNLIKGRKDIVLRFYSYEGFFKDLSFLEFVPNATKLVLDDKSIDDISILASLKGLQSLKISQTQKKNLNLSPLLDLNELNSLELYGNYRIEPLLQQNRSFQELALTSFNIGDLDVLSKQKYLKLLILSKCTFSNEDSIGKCHGLEYLYLEKVKVIDVDFISRLVNLNFLALESLNIKKLPFLGECRLLRSICIINLPYLESLRQLSSVQSIRELVIRNVNIDDVNEFEFLKTNKNIKRLEIQSKNKKLMSSLRERYPDLQSRSKF